MRSHLVRTAVLEIYEEVRRQDARADEAMQRVLRREKALRSVERRAVADAVYGLLRLQGRVDHLLGRALQTRKLDKIVLLMQANPFITPRRGPNGFDSLLERVRALVAANPAKVIVVNGDSHTYRVDEPLPGLRRIEPWGSPIVSWLRGTISGGDIAVSVAAIH